jgi:DNA repair protein RadA/Sms
MGRCPNCGQFNTFQEVTEEVKKPAVQERRLMNVPRSVPQRLAEVSNDTGERYAVPMGELNRVLGGGLVPGSITLIGGEPGIGKCVTGDTRVLDPTTGAYLPITAWETTSHSVLSLDEATLTASPDRVTAFHRQGIRPIVEVKTRLGYTLRCTPSHPLMTLNGWQPVEALTAGTRVATPRALPYFGTLALSDEEVKLIAYLLSDGHAGAQISVTSMLEEVEKDLEDIALKFETNLKKYPKKNNRASQYRLCENRELLKERQRNAREKFSSVIHKAFSSSGISRVEWAKRANVTYSQLNIWWRGESVPDADSLNRLAMAIDLTPEELGESWCAQARQGSKVMQYAEKIGLRGSRARNKRIPDFIFRLNKTQLLCFIRVLFSCDGSLYVTSRGQAGISYGSISLGLIEDVQHLLLRFGFACRIRNKEKKMKEGVYTSYELQLLGTDNVNRFITEIGIYGRNSAKSKLESLPDTVRKSTQFDVIPTDTEFYRAIISAAETDNFSNISRLTGKTIKNRRHGQPITRQQYQTIAKSLPHPYLTRLAHSDVYWDEIVSITPAGEEEVYDLSVADHPNFVANNLHIHNSTLLLQSSGMLANTIGTVLYVSGEESSAQIKMRADRLGLSAHDLYLLTETKLEDIFEQVTRLNPTVLIIDSIQTTYTETIDGSPGLVSQVRECASRLQGLAKSSAVSVFLVGHVTKEGTIAGPRVLEHIVDTVLYLEGDPFQAFRLLRSVKNRFGATSEVGVFEMQGAGMVEVPNPSEAFLAERVINAPGSAIAVTMEGTRPLLVEIQALTSPTPYGNPRRTPNGVDMNRLLLLSAVLTKRFGLRLSEHDIFVNVVGGMKISEPASDLAMAVAMASSYHDVPLPADMVLIGEVGLSGEVRAVSQLGARLNEAAKIGFKRAVIPRLRRPLDGLPKGMEVIHVRTVGDALKVAVPKP